MLWGNADHPLAGGDEEALQGAGDMAAVLDRPDPLRIQGAGPAQELLVAGLARAGTVESPRSSAVRASTAPAVWVDLWVSAPITIICIVLSIGCRLRTDLRRTKLTWGDAKLLSSHVGDPRAAASDTTGESQTSAVDTQYRSQLAAGPRTNRPGRTPPTADLGR